jgi:FHS family L-fucose permease-like MFS transporter
MPIAPGAPSAAASSEPQGRYLWPLIFLASLFFMWGFITVLNDALIPHLKAVFVMNNAQSALIQFCFFMAYGIFSIPAAKLVEWIGYKTSIVVGLAVMAAGCLLFLPASNIPSYYVFLAAMFVVAGGITLLQVAANPYVSVLGPAKTSSMRLNLVQGLNSFGTFLAPAFGSLLILGRSTTGTSKAGAVITLAERMQDAKAVQAPYVGIAIVLLVIAAGFWVMRLPKVSTHAETAEAKRDTVWRHPMLALGVIGIFLYVGAEVAIGSFMTNYIASPHVLGATTEVAARYVSFYWGGAMVGRFVGAALMRWIHPGVILGVNAVCAVVAIALSVFTTGDAALWAIVSVGFFNSIMFPTIFTLAIKGLGPLTGRGSGYLIMAIVGGAVVPYLQGQLADRFGLTASFLTSAPCYLFILYFALKSFGRRELDAEAGEPALAAH